MYWRRLSIHVMRSQLDMLSVAARCSRLRPCIPTTSWPVSMANSSAEPSRVRRERVRKCETLLLRRWVMSSFLSDEVPTIAELRWAEL